MPQSLSPKKDGKKVEEKPKLEPAQIAAGGACATNRSYHPSASFSKVINSER